MSVSSEMNVHSIDYAIGNGYHVSANEFLLSNENLNADKICVDNCELIATPLKNNSHTSPIDNVRENFNFIIANKSLSIGNLIFHAATKVMHILHFKAKYMHEQ